MYMKEQQCKSCSKKDVCKYIKEFEMAVNAVDHASWSMGDDPNGKGVMVQYMSSCQWIKTITTCEYYQSDTRIRGVGELSSKEVY
jgi:hypothetical protein